MTLRIRSDSVSTLTLLIKLRTSHGLGLVAREMALEFGASSYKPLLFQHIPGLSNDWADALSRLDQPGKGAKIPTSLLSSTRTPVPIRDVEYYQALRPLCKTD